ncbi:hypothetical protein Tco_0716033 [Tanacetum coccineum]
MKGRKIFKAKFYWDSALKNWMLGFQNFQEDDQDDLSSDGESQEGDVANKADNNESDLRRVSTRAQCHENDTAHQFKIWERLVTYEEVKRADLGIEFKKAKWDDFLRDFETALDSVKWDYLDETLNAFGFGLKWRNWISSCLNNAMGSEVAVNGSLLWSNPSSIKGLKPGTNVFAAAASLIGCSILTAPLIILVVRSVSNNVRINTWDEVISKVPIGVLNHLESIRRNFFYGVDGSDRKLAWIGWNMVLTSKLDMYIKEDDDQRAFGPMGRVPLPSGLDPTWLCGLATPSGLGAM